MRKHHSRLGRILNAFGIGKKKGSKFNKRRSLHCEPLEQRQLLSLCVWDGGGGNGLWTNRFNWQNDVAPVAGDDLKFAGTVQTSTQNDFTAGTSFHSIEFANTGLSITSNSNSFVLPANAYIYVDTGTATIAANIALDGWLNVSAAGASLTISGALSNDGSNAGRVKVLAGGTLTLSGANTYTGQTTVYGTLDVAGGNNRLSTSGNIQVNGGTLDLGGYSQTTSGYLSLAAR